MAVRQKVEQIGNMFSALDFDPSYFLVVAGRFDAVGFLLALLKLCTAYGRKLWALADTIRAFRRGEAAEDGTIQFHETQEDAMAAARKDPRARVNAGACPAAMLKLDARLAGISLKKLRELGYGADAVREAGYVEGLSGAGYEIGDVRKAGYACTEARRAGNGIEDMRRAGFGPSEMREAGFDAGQLKAAGLEVRELKAGGFDAGQLIGS